MAERISWLRNVFRITDRKYARRALMHGEGERRSRGRARKMWLEATKKDLRMLETELWIEAAGDRKKLFSSLPVPTQHFLVTRTSSALSTPE